MAGLFGMFEPSDEQKAAYEAAKAQQEDLGNRFRRMLAEELTPDQLEVMRHVFSFIANCQNSANMANWYEGIIHGAIFVRDVRLGESIDSPALLQLTEAGRLDEVVSAAMPEELLRVDDDDDDDDDDLPPDPFE